MDRLIEVAGIIFGWLLGAGGAVLDWILAVASAILGWVLVVAGAILGWLMQAGGAVLHWVFGRGIQEPMSVLQGVGAIATAIAVWGAYLQYRDKRYGLSDGEWDILKALCQYRFGFFPWYNNWPSYMIDKMEVYLESDLQSDVYRNKLEYYPPDPHHALLNMTVITYTEVVKPRPMNRLRNSPRIDLLLTARTEDQGSGSTIAK